MFDSETDHRRSIRLRGYDYAQVGRYFVTICTQSRERLFGEVIEGQVCLSEIGSIVQECWAMIPRHFPNVRLDACVVMPNHLHGIVVITSSRCRARPAPSLEQFGAPAAGSLASVIRLFKQAVSRRAKVHSNLSLRVWQRNYYEHIIRNEIALNKIRQYICQNPLRWPDDRENPARLPGAADEIEEILAGDTGSFAEC